MLYQIVWFDFSGRSPFDNIQQIIFIPSLVLTFLRTKKKKKSDNQVPLHSSLTHKSFSYVRLVMGDNK